MAITITTDSATVSTTEYFLFGDSTTASYQTADAHLEVFLRFASMAAGDQFRWRFYEKTNGQTATVIMQGDVIGVQAQDTQIICGLVGEGYEISVQKIAGTDRTVHWSLRKIDHASGGASAADVADAVWDEARAGHVSAGSFGEGVLVASGGITATSLASDTITAAKIASDAITSAKVADGFITANKIAADAITAAKLAADVTTEITSGLALSTQVDALEAAVIAIEADTQDIQGRLPAALVSGRIDASVGAMATGVITADATAADFTTEVTAGLATAANVAAVETDTQDIQSRLPAALVSGRIDASVGAMAANVITAAATHADFTSEVTSGLATTFDVSGVAALVTDVQGRIPAALVGGRIDASVGAVASGVIEFADLASDLVAALGVVRRNTAQAGGATTITLDASASATDDFYNGTLVFIAAGTGAGQARTITDYVGATKVATVATWTTNPDNTSTFVIFAAVAASGGGGSGPTAEEIADAVLDEALAGHATAGTVGAGLTTLLTGTAAIEADTQDIQGRLPAALVSGRIDASMGAVTAAAADAIIDNECDSTAPDGAKSVREILNICVSFAAAEATGLHEDGDVDYQNTGGTKSRISGTFTEGARTDITLDGTE